MQGLPCPALKASKLSPALGTAGGFGRSFLSVPVCVWEKKKIPWKQFTEPCRDHVQQPCCLATCPRWEWCFLSWSSNPPIQRHYPLVGSSGETNRHCSSEGPCPSCLLLGNQETFCLKEPICQIFTARQLVKAFAFSEGKLSVLE